MISLDSSRLLKTVLYTEVSYSHTIALRLYCLVREVGSIGVATSTLHWALPAYRFRCFSATAIVCRYQEISADVAYGSNGYAKPFGVTP